MKKAFRISVVVYGAMLIIGMFFLIIGGFIFGWNEPLPFWFYMIMATLILFPLPMVAILAIIAHAKDTIKGARDFIKNGK